MPFFESGREKPWTTNDACADFFFEKIIMAVAWRGVRHVGACLLLDGGCESSSEASRGRVN